MEFQSKKVVCIVGLNACFPKQAFLFVLRRNSSDRFLFNTKPDLFYVVCAPTPWQGKIDRLRREGKCS